MPSKADEIRAYALERYVLPWRRSGGKRLSIRSGDVVRGMGLRNATPNVCNALASRKFQHEAGIVLLDRAGPRQSKTTTFHYESGMATSGPAPRRGKGPEFFQEHLQPRVDRTAPDRDCEWRSADLFLVSCVSVKRPGAAPAKDLYVSAWFVKARACVEALGCRWYILSSKHGLLDPGATIEPYNETLKTMPVRLRRAWARRVIGDLSPHLGGAGSVCVFAGMAYREFLEPELRGRGLTVHVPMEGMPIGRQLSWLSGQVRS